MKELVYICYSIQELDELFDRFASGWGDPWEFRPGYQSYDIRASYIIRDGAVGIVAKTGTYSRPEYFKINLDKFDVMDFRDAYPISYGTAKDIGSTSIDS